MGTLYYEDISVGDVFDSRGRTITKAEILDFASRFDPQPFHVDTEAARDSMFGGLIASGFHTLAICQRLASSAFFEDINVVAGVGLENLRFIAPVYPDDTLTATVSIRDKRPMADRQDGGYVDVGIEGFNQQGDPVIAWTALTIMARNPDNR